ncbi:hypothetical protein Tsubulata_031397 [Turnera subulata]|uniref:Agenet-like domain-containing protein n=1 Tax=Turnera subulata TaxID=218843 RepID=A0A9Q0JD97_9ROSI|nr:hypothetical protein Tsubulata_031397 [Turnera subulata]
MGWRSIGMGAFRPKVGQMMEERSFLHGFRGAWFRCKIKEVSGAGYQTKIVVEYPDFPEQKSLSPMLYRKPNKTKSAKMELMFRPQYPLMYRESQLLEINTISEEAVIVTDAWKIHLLPPPAGEGSSYEASCKDLRPSLDWTPEHEGISNLTNHDIGLGSLGNRHVARASVKRKEIQIDCMNASMEHKETKSHLIGKKSDENISLHSTCFPSPVSEVAILDLEKLLDRVKWMKHILQSGTSLSNTMPPLWTFVEHCPPVPK